MPTPSWVRFEVADGGRLEQVERAKLPLGLRAGAEERRFHRDVYLDTPDGALDRRGVTCRLRIDWSGGRTLVVVVGQRGSAENGAAGWMARTDAPEADLPRLLSGDSEPARLVQAVVDPTRLAPVIELEVDRRVRVARWWGFPQPSYELRYDRVTLRAGERVAAFAELALRRVGRVGPSVSRLAQALARRHGLRPTVSDQLRRARSLLADLDVEAARAAARVGREVAVLPFRHGLLGLRCEAEGLQVLVGPGGGEATCRDVLESAFGTSQSQVRLLGTAPAAGGRPPLEVWLARRLPEQATTGAAIEWVALDRVPALVGMPLLRDPRTLAALHVAAQADLMREQPTWVRPSGPPPEPIPTASPDHHSPTHYLNPDQSLLAFHERVLELAGDPFLSLSERLRFLSIYAANLDEFFMVRVGALKGEVAESGARRGPDGLTASQSLDAVAIRVRELTRRASRLLAESLIPALAAQGVRFRRWAELDDDVRSQLTRYFREQVYPLLTPLAATPAHPFPHIASVSISLAAMVRHRETGVRHFATVNLPRSLPRLVPLPTAGEWIPLEALVCANIRELFAGLEVERAHTFRVTRSADIRYGEARASDLLQAIEEGVERRPYLPVVRIEVERTMPGEMRELLLQEFRFELPERVSLLGRGDVYQFEPEPGLHTLREVALAPPPSAPLPVPAGTPFPPGQPVLSVIAKHDVLVHFPYDSFPHTVEQFLVEAADDPSVVAIKLALYRSEDRSRLREALLRARVRGKTVVALIELKARFDEAHNIEWARELRAAGVHVVYGQIQEKTHAKVALVVRREGGTIRWYSYVATGNFHALTAAGYTDFGLFTADPAVGADLNDLFNDLTGHAAPRAYRRILVSPGGLLPRLLELIRREADHARAGRPARIRAKMNGLDDPEVIDALYRAAQAGVSVELVVRGLCSLRPGIPGLSDGIRVVSVLGEFLEHGRVCHFANGGADEYYIGSADWRQRNLRRRVEVVVPITDPASAARLDHVLTVELADPTGWDLLPDGSYRRRTPFGTAVTGAQERLKHEARSSGSRDPVIVRAGSGVGGTPGVPILLLSRHAFRHQDRM